MTNKIKHSGIIESVDKDLIRVRIVQTSACATCSVAGHCNASDTKEKLVDIFDFDADCHYAVGDTIIVSASSKMGFRAVSWAFIIPFVLMVAVLFMMISATHNEPVSALSSLLVLIPYYLVLHYKREYIKEQLSFEIER